jgi:hypothetical protein
MTTEMITVYLSAAPNIQLVERRLIQASLSELGLSLTGFVDATQAARVGAMVGAQIMVSGRIMWVDDELIITSRMIGVETTRVVAEMVSGTPGDQIAPLVEDLAARIGRVVVQDGPKLVAPAPGPGDPLEELKIRLAGRRLPRVAVVVREMRDGAPAALSTSQTTLQSALRKCGFEILEEDDQSLTAWTRRHLSGKRVGIPPATKADVLVVGEAVEEFGARVGELVSSTAQVELRAIETQNGEILAVAQRENRAVDLSARMAGRKAIRSATAVLAPGLLAEIAERWDP